MSRSKKVFVLLSVVFLFFLLYVSYDISSRTTFPGSKPELKERVVDQFMEPDTILIDSGFVNSSEE